VISTRLRYSGISSLLAVLSRPTVPFPLRARGLYLLTPVISRARAAEAAAVMELVRTRCECAALLGWAAGAFEVEEESDDARMTGSKCSFSRSNSSESGAESSNFCSCAGALCSDGACGKETTYRRGQLVSRMLCRLQQSPTCNGCSTKKKEARRLR
jgi:hypothetical protein